MCTPTDLTYEMKYLEVQVQLAAASWKVFIHVGVDD